MCLGESLSKIPRIKKTKRVFGRGKPVEVFTKIEILQYIYISNEHKYYI